MKITFVYADDWEGIYVDDKLVMENHSLDGYLVAEKLSELFGFELRGRSVNQCWIESRGNLPENLSDVLVYGDGDDE
jgi:hypothetical protein